ncbi:MAG: hypothetical protein H8E44_02990, partial [Planctomycetes bacterium]|nr:hypothetical protein [Planctomycetota bacterium]
MRRKEALICDSNRPFAETVAKELRSLGWTVHKTHDEAEAGYRLLVWYHPSELPELAILNTPDATGLLHFCTLLKEEGILELVSVIVLLDEA